ncbi:MAG: hypothetical protein RR406_00030 [Bacilli bacterium]
MKILKLDNVTGEVLEKFNSQREAAENANCSLSLIRQACVWSFKGITAKGYRYFALNEITGRNYYKLGKYFSEEYEDENLTLEEVNEQVFKRRKEIEDRKQKYYNNKPKTMKLICNKCGNICQLNQYKTIKSIKEDNNFIIDSISSDNSIKLKCNNCETTITLK